MLAKYCATLRDRIRNQAMTKLRFSVTVYVRKGLITMLLMTVGTFVTAELLFARQAAVPATETAVASKRKKDLTITITSADGRLKGGENSFCVMFEKKETEEPVDVQNVSLDFTLLVGKIQEEPVKAQLTEDRVGRYCGNVNLGKQYYVPASYYGFVLYTDAAGKKRKERLFLSVR
jgi:hypothetical protein